MVSDSCCKEWGYTTIRRTNDFFHLVGDQTSTKVFSDYCCCRRHQGSCRRFCNCRSPLGGNLPRDCCSLAAGKTACNTLPSGLACSGESARSGMAADERRPASPGQQSCEGCIIP